MAAFLTASRLDSLFLGCGSCSRTKRTYSTQFSGRILSKDSKAVCAAFVLAMGLSVAAITVELAALVIVFVDASKVGLNPEQANGCGSSQAAEAGATSVSLT